MCWKILGERLAIRTRIAAPVRKRKIDLKCGSSKPGSGERSGVVDAPSRVIYAASDKRTTSTGHARPRFPRTAAERYGSTRTAASGHDDARWATAAAFGAASRSSSASSRSPRFADAARPSGVRRI